MPRRKGSEVPAHPTLVHVAAAAGVSVKTASRVFAGSDKVTAATAEKVKSAAELIGYHSNVLARELRVGALSSLMGMVVSDLGNPFYAAMAAAVADTLDEAGVELMLTTSHDEPMKERRLITSLLERRVRGLVIVPTGTDYSFLDIERRRGFSFVFVDRPAPFLAADSVLVDNRQGAAEALDHLLREGCRHVALIADDPTIWTASQRIQGFEEAARQRRLMPEDFTVVSGAHTESAAASIATELLTAAHPADGIIAANTRIALGAAQSRARLGLQSQLVCFDHFEGARAMGIATLTHDPADIGRAVARLLLQRCAQPVGASYEQVIVPVRIAVD